MFEVLKMLHFLITSQTHIAMKNIFVFFLSFVVRVHRANLSKSEPFLAFQTFQAPEILLRDPVYGPKNRDMGYILDNMGKTKGK
jgi:hypothetical protein